MMNVDQDRPFVCIAPGCSQSFQREDHLIIHRHKHEMTLKFPSIKCDSMLSDQTPTPTRFLRDCEEVGLFTDLELNQSQTEEQTKPNFSAQTSAQRQPHTETQPEQGQHQQFQPQQQQSCALAHLNQNQLQTHSSQCQSQCTATYSSSNKQSAPSCLHSRQTNTVKSNMNMESQMSMNSSIIGIPGPAHSGSCSSVQMSSTPKQSHCPQSPPQPATGRRRRTAEDDPDERRRKFLERNRAAATRCRQKRKVWVSSLERKAEELTHTNLQLQNEVTSLRTEVTQLKQILLTHKDCPVSVRQRETQSGIGSPTGSPVHSHAIQHNSISTSSTLPRGHLTTHSHSTSNTQL
nr:cyclic AMP-responsive element-binding protein 5-like isoform X2 [Danio rerio]|eukprot:XP_009292466.1 cyclic AMP-responsive element-binding protein 5-like isoform X2 [Danio rerio]